MQTVQQVVIAFLQLKKAGLEFVEELPNFSRARFRYVERFDPASDGQVMEKNLVRIPSRQQSLADCSGPTRQTRRSLRVILQSIEESIKWLDNRHKIVTVRRDCTKQLRVFAEHFLADAFNPIRSQLECFWGLQQPLKNVDRDLGNK